MYNFIAAFVISGLGAMFLPVNVQRGGGDVIEFELADLYKERDALSPSERNKIININTKITKLELQLGQKIKKAQLRGRRWDDPEVVKNLIVQNYKTSCERDPVSIEDCEEGLVEQIWGTLLKQYANLNITPPDGRTLSKKKKVLKKIKKIQRRLF